MPRGGKRTPGPGKSLGRPPKNEYPTRLIKVQMSRDEWQQLKDRLPSDTRLKALVMLSALLPPVGIDSYQMAVEWRCSVEEAARRMKEEGWKFRGYNDSGQEVFERPES